MAYTIVALVAYIAGGCTLGVLISAMRFQKPSGTLKADQSTGETYLFLELDEPVDMVLDKKLITLKVDPTDL